MSILFSVIFIIEIIFIAYIFYKIGHLTGHIKGYKKAEAEILGLIEKLKVELNSNGKTGKAK